MTNYLLRPESQDPYAALQALLHERNMAGSSEGASMHKKRLKRSDASQQELTYLHPTGQQLHLIPQLRGNCDVGFLQEVHVFFGRERRAARSDNKTENRSRRKCNEVLSCGDPGFVELCMKNNKNQRQDPVTVRCIPVEGHVSRQMPRNSSSSSSQSQPLEQVRFTEKCH